MMEQIYNPYLPLTEYVPDGEPHVFDGRVYIYGSHDKSEGIAYCEQDYVTWSAPVDNLKDWRYEGVIYRKNQDPSNAEGRMQLWAPDVTKGPDGRYYLYYCFSFYPEIGVAVSDSPAGPFEFYGHVKYPENLHGGAVLREYMPFDPAVLTDDDGRVYLYYGFAPACEKEMKFPELSPEELAAMSAERRAGYEKIKSIQFGENGMVAELKPDMITLKGEPSVSIPGGHHTEGTGFFGHGFFEASSIRKINGKYYFVYSSHKSHELCYAVSDFPDRDFEYGGTIVSNGDVGFNGREMPSNVLGNNHGGIEKIGEDYYIFYHRQTNG
ncbi:MAG: family 43 glycosylhydrolase [Lachnospiraceae bacterium]|nr:family 43 glycosylhydrolase [Lachnospiraceae bacterium]